MTAPNLHETREIARRAGTADEIVVDLSARTPSSLARHDAARLFPEMSEEEFAALTEDVRQQGVRQPILVYEGRILDGWHRYRVTEILGIDCPTIEWAGDEKEILPLVVSLNLRRRHLDESQRALVAARIATLPHGSNQWTGKLAAPTQAEAGALVNVSERSVRTAREVLDRGAPELVAAVARGEVSVSAAADVATLPAEEQAEVVARGEREILKRACEVRQRRRQEEKEEWREHWRGMPEFIQADHSPWRSITVHFASPADMEAFERLVGQRLTTKTRSIWYPEAEIASMADKRYAAEKAPRHSIDAPRAAAEDEA